MERHPDEALVLECVRILIAADPEGYVAVMDPFGEGFPEAVVNDAVRLGRAIVEAAPTLRERPERPFAPDVQGAGS